MDFSMALYSEINFFCMILLTFVLFKSWHGYSRTGKQRFFHRLLLCSLLFVTVDIGWSQIEQQHFAGAMTLNWIFNTLYYILSGSVTYYWFLYSETAQRSSFVSNRRHRRWCRLPLYLIIVLNLTSCWTGWMFSIDADNAYHRGPLFPLQLLLVYGYLLLTAGKAFYQAHRAATYTKRSEYLALSIYVIPSLIMGLVQLYDPLLPTAGMGNTLGAISVFVNELERKISLDSLTRLNNRFQLDRFLVSRLSHYREDAAKQLFLVVADINNFKSINDQYGHIEGDRALMCVASVFRRALRSGFAARYGGDEFVLLCEAGSQNEVEELCRNLDKMLAQKAALLPYSLTLSMGIARYTRDFQRVEDFIAAADAAMYDQKAGIDWSAVQE